LGNIENYNDFKLCNFQKFETQRGAVLSKTSLLRCFREVLCLVMQLSLCGSVVPCSLRGGLIRSPLRVTQLCWLRIVPLCTIHTSHATDGYQQIPLKPAR
jgi:hypothetical protein